MGGGHASRTWIRNDSFDTSQWYKNSAQYQDDLARREAQAAADRREAAINDAVHQAIDADPPSASELGVDIEGAGPDRAALIRYVAWREVLRRTRDDLEEGLAALHRAVDAPRLTEADIEPLTAEDKSSLLAAVRNARRGLDLSVIRSAEKNRFLAKLSDDQHAAEVAASAIETAEFELEIASRRLAAVEHRHELFINARCARWRPNGWPGSSSISLRRCGLLIGNYAARARPPVA